MAWDLAESKADRMATQKKMMRGGSWRALCRDGFPDELEKNYMQAMNVGWVLSGWGFERLEF